VAEFILALDQGTTSSRAVLFNHEGTVHAIAQQELPQIYPQPGWVEHDPDVIWSSQSGVAARVMAEAGVSPASVRALGITNQRETTILWNRETGRPVHNAIVWQDRRSAPVIRQWLVAGLGPTIQSVTGLIPDAYFSASKIRWLLDNIPEAARLAERGQLAFGTVDSWLLYRLTDGAVHATDVTNASRTMLFDIRELQWSDELLEQFGIPRSLLPRVQPSAGLFGETVPGLFGAALPVMAMAGDQHAATFGQACFEPGMTKNTYGTGCFLVMNTGTQLRRSASNLLTTVAWQLGSANGPAAASYALEGSVFIGGAVVQWLRDSLSLVGSSADVEQLARSETDNGGVSFVPAFAGLGAPHWDPDARGLIIGLTRGTTAGHLARAALESIALQVADVITAMESDSRQPLVELRVDGGGAVNDLLLQFQSDILGVPVLRPAVTETTALGAAYLAGLAAGFWRDEAELAAQWTLAARFEPGMPASERAWRRERWQEAVQRSRGWASPAQPD
jgi:glycerol kinase